MKTSSTVQWQQIGSIALITVDYPPVNALARDVRKGLVDALDAVTHNGAAAIVLLCAGRTFIAGADIREFGQPPQAPLLAELLERLESSPLPVLAAIHGQALGGGLEVALACHYRLALDSARLGLPEVNLGLIPGGGGTQRLPRLIGADAALDLIVGGKPVTAAQALELGLLDRVVSGDLRQRAIDYATELLALKSAAEDYPQRTGRLPVAGPASDAEFWTVQHARVARRYRGQLAPRCAVEAVQAAAQLPLAEGLALERTLFSRCVESPQSTALRYLFFAEREAARVALPSEAETPPVVERVGVVGAGTMGRGIAVCFANAGLPVTLVEQQADALQAALVQIDRLYAAEVDKGRLDRQQAGQRRGLIRASLSFEDLATADLVVEAVYEDLQVKHEVFARLDRVCRPEAILASNTSYQDVGAIARASQRPQRVIGMHFFSPAQIMKLLEVVRTDFCSPAVLGAVMALGKRIGKTCVVVGVGYGFVGNRIFSAYGREAQQLLLEGNTPQQIDAALEHWGMAMGPLAVADLAGLDIGYRARRARPSDDPAYFRPADLLVEQGRLGQKSGLGFYRYDGRARYPDDEVPALIGAEARRLGVAQNPASDDEIVERLVFAMVNEAAQLLEEGLVERASDIDVVMANGYGFPRWRGGPMHYADSLGLGQVLDKVQGFARRCGPRYWQPAPRLQTLAAAGEPFIDKRS